MIVVFNVDESRRMDSQSATDALFALAQLTRLQVFRMLVRHEPEWLSTRILHARDRRPVKLLFNTKSTL